MKEKIKKDAKTVYTTTTRVIKNTEHLALALALLVCASYNAYDLSIRPVDTVELYVRAFCSVLIGLKGALEVVRALDKEV